MQTNPHSGQIEITGRYGTVFLYTHNKASDLLRTVRTVLTRQKYWQDEDYLSSMLFRELTRYEDNIETDGYGIGTKMYINADILISLDIPQQKIHIISISNKTHQCMVFEEFINNFSGQAKL
jgi:hypothetical protein